MANKPPAWSMAALLFARRSFAFRTFVRSLASRYATMRWLICRRSMPGPELLLARCANDFIRVIVLRLGVGSLVLLRVRRPWLLHGACDQGEQAL